MSIYSFVRGITGKLGVGTADLGFERSHSIPLSPLEGPGQFVTRGFGVTAPGYVKLGKDIVPVSWLGDTGVYVPNPVLLQRLAEQAKG